MSQIWLNYINNISYLLKEEKLSKLVLGKFVNQFFISLLVHIENRQIKNP